MSDRKISFENSKNVAFDNKINSEGDVLINSKKITNIFLNHDYNEIIKERERIENDLKRIPKHDKEWLIEKLQQLESVKEKERLFKEYVMQIAKNLSSITYVNERLKKAIDLFEEGKFKEADTLLDYEELKKDKEYFISQQKVGEQILEDALNARAEISNEFLLKAQLTLTQFENIDRIRDAEKYFKESIQVFPNLEALFSFSVFLQNHNRQKDAIQYLEKIFEHLSPITNAGLLSNIFNNLGILYRDCNDFKKAIHYFESAVKIRRELANKDNGFKTELGVSLNNLGLLHSDEHNFTIAEDYYLESLAIQRELTKQEAKEEYTRNLALTLCNLGIFYLEVGNASKGVPFLMESNELYRELEKINKRFYLPHRAAVIDNLSLAYKDNNEFAKAISYSKEALKLRKTLYQENPLRFGPDLASTLNNLGIIYKRAKKINSAEKYLAEAVKLRKEQSLINPEVFDQKLGIALFNYGNILIQLNKYAQASEKFQQVMDIYQKLFIQNPRFIFSRLLEAMNKLGGIKLKLGKILDAEKILLDSVKFYEENNKYSYQEALISYFKSLQKLAMIYSQTGKFHKAINFFEKILEKDDLLDKSEKINMMPLFADTNYFLGNLYIAIDDDSKGTERILESIPLLEKLIEEHPETAKNKLARLYFSLGQVYFNDNKISKSIKCLANSISYFQDIINKEYYSSSEEVLQVHIFLTKIFLSQNKIKRAKRQFAELNSLIKSEKVLKVKYNVDVKIIESNILYTEQKFDEAKVILREVISNNSIDDVYEVGKAYFQLAEIEFCNNEFKNAIGSLEKLVNILQNSSPKSSELKMMISRALINISFYLMHDGAEKNIAIKYANQASEVISNLSDERYVHEKNEILERREWIVSKYN